MVIWKKVYDNEFELETVPWDLVWYKSTTNYDMIICLYVYKLFNFGNYMKESIYDTVVGRYDNGILTGVFLWWLMPMIGIK